MSTHAFESNEVSENELFQNFFWNYVLQVAAYVLNILSSGNFGCIRSWSNLTAVDSKECLELG